ncbi:SDR family NAD(P)-dependent oxidoreductase [Cypionkella sp. TWP1-2-1b2]|uniref:SDR family NAD(P)-dependent oxidoreductase n=1 Tax=Cypionkella sp. TWP1-2-1b2 TaxID=2804675 RepID=UPI003CF1441D
MIKNITSLSTDGKARVQVARPTSGRLFDADRTGVGSQINIYPAYKKLARSSTCRLDAPNSLLCAKQRRRIHDQQSSETGKVMIWGDTGGVGFASARILASSGFDLHLVARDASKLAALADKLADSTSRADVQNDTAFARVSAEAGASLAGLVNAVGSINLRPLAQLMTAVFVRNFRVNAIVAALTVQAVLAELKAAPQIASVVLFSSVAVAQDFAAHASVSMAKGTVKGLTRALPAEATPKIRINSIAPSLTDTPLAAMLPGNPQISASIAQSHALPRLGKPKDIAALAVFLISYPADWMSGQVIAVGCGCSCLRTRAERGQPTW